MKKYGITVDRRGGEREGTIDGETDTGPTLMGEGRAFAPAAQAPSPKISRTKTQRPSASSDGYSFCLEDGHPVANAAEGNGMRQWDDVLAVSARLAEGRCVEKNPRGFTRRPECGGEDRLVTGLGGQFFRASSFWGAQTGPNPTDRAKNGSKHHILTEAQGIPLAAEVTPANTPDVKQLLPLVEAIPPVRGQRGRPRCRPDRLQGDKGYDSEPHRQELRARGIEPVVPKRRKATPKGLGKKRWFVERTISWIHQFRRMRVRFERRADIHKAFLTISCILVCWNFLS
jgi:transposase